VPTPPHHSFDYGSWLVEHGCKEAHFDEQQMMRRRSHSYACQCELLQKVKEGEQYVARMIDPGIAQMLEKANLEQSWE